MRACICPAMYTYPLNLKFALIFLVSYVVRFALSATFASYPLVGGSKDNVYVATLKSSSDVAGTQTSLLPVESTTQVVPGSNSEMPLRSDLDTVRLSGYCLTTECVTGDELIARVEELGAVGSVQNAEGVPHGVNRPYLSDVGASARMLVMQYMEEASMDASVDAVGNVLGKLECKNTEHIRKVLVLGSHHDTVVNGGKWDGAYGVLASIAVAKVVAKRPDGVCSLPFDIHVVSFDDEEGNNSFGTTNLGAKAYSGQLHEFENDVVADAFRRDAFLSAFDRQFGKSSPSAVWKALQTAAFVNPERIIGFIELHIEQGPVLVEQNASVGVVSAIAGQTRMTLRFAGSVGHAGTVPMEMRRDALVAAAEVITFADAIAKKHTGGGVVATVGTLQVAPGSTNVIPGSVTMSLDVRAAMDSDRISVVKEILAHCRQVGNKRNIQVSTNINHEVGAVSMSPWLQDVLKRAVSATNHNSDDDTPYAASSAHVMDSELVMLNDTDVLKDNNSILLSDIKNSMCPLSKADNNNGLQECSLASGKTSFTSTSRDAAVLLSGAGHDTQFMARIAPSAMLFVRCRDGISHSPMEHVSSEDAKAGALTLLAAVDEVAKRERI